MPVEIILPVKHMGMSACAFARHAVSGVLVCALMLSGCTHPLFDDDSATENKLNEHLGAIDSMKLTSYASTGQLTLETDDDGIIVVKDDTSGEAKDAPPAKTVDLSLGEVRASALENNLDLKAQRVSRLMAKERANAEAAKFEAAFFGTFATSRSDEEYQGVDDDADETVFGPGIRYPLAGGGEARIGGEMIFRDADDPDDDKDIAALRFSLSQPLFRGAGTEANVASIKIMDIEDRITQARTKLEAIRVLANADKAYWLLYAANHELDIYYREQKEAKKQLEGARRRVDAGVAASIEIVRAEAGVAESREKVIRSEMNINLCQRALKRLINRDDLPIDSPTRLIPVTEPALVKYALSRREMADKAVENRMEMVEVELELASDTIRTNAQRNQALPLFTLDFDYAFGGEGMDMDKATSSFGDSDYQEWTVGLRTDIQIGNKAAKSRVRRAVLRRIKRLATQEQREQAIRQEVFDALDRLDYQWEQILAARDSVVTSGRRFDAEQRQFEVGLRTSTDVFDAVRLLSRAQVAEIQALAEYQIAKVDLTFATGTLLGHSRIIWMKDRFGVQ